jgi:predicted ATPase
LEAIGHLTRALRALELLPENAERDRQELTIQNTIGTPLIAVHGYASPEAGVAFNRARVLSGRLGDASALFATLSGEWAFHYVRGDHRMMREVVDEAESAANQTRNEPLGLVPFRCGGQSALYFGEFEAARDAFETILRTYDRSRHRPPAVHYIHDTKLYALTYLPVIYWILGYPDQARKLQSVALDYAGGLAQAAVSTFVRIYAGAGLDELLLDAPAAGNHADTIIDLAGQHSLGYFRMGGQISKGWAMARQGAGLAGLELMRRSATERLETGATWWQIRYLCMLAETCGQHDRDKEGLAAVAEATELMERTHEHMWKAELTRIEGELRNQQSDAAGEIEARFQRSLSIARHQNARAFELRAAMGLARLWTEQGRRSEAREVLAPV